MRRESDSIGSVNVPDDAYYSVQSIRAKENFPMTGRLMHPYMVDSLVVIKKAAAMANQRAGTLKPEIATAIIRACDEVLAGKLRDQFIVDPIQGGAGTSANMNANEVIANRATEILGGKLGEFLVHPNDHVNMAQSTNDVFPSAGKLAALRMTGELLDSLDQLIEAMEAKAQEYAHVIKLGRTQLQDAVPMFLGQEFKAHANALRRCVMRILKSRNELFDLNLGATAIGTSINATEGYLDCVVDILADLVGQPLKAADDLIDATQNPDCFAAISSAVKNCALVMSKIANDMRLLSSGPCGGIEELQLPACQHGSSIMPGKINPVIPEVVTQAAFLVAGNDVTISMAVEAGQLELNAFEPVLFYCLFESLQVLARAADTFRLRCIEGVTANVEHCNQLLMQSMAIATALCPAIGYEKATAIVKKALKEHRTAVDVALEELSMPKEEIERIVSNCLEERHG
ncbi:MAG TPA: aspartate ammonia-lyase [Candidatus Excrementavichristensenella intestinipullorum]|nr:aspartate ammonia-lyase [Candidatus Excrementavichristensenella intestinipullorum]